MGEVNKDGIDAGTYEAKAKEALWEGSGMEHHALNRVLYSYLSLYTKNDAELIIHNAEEGNGVEAYRRLTSQYSPKTARLAHKHLEDVMEIAKSKRPEEIWTKIEEIDDHSKLYKENHTKNLEMDDDAKMVAM